MKVHTALKASPKIKNEPSPREAAGRMGAWHRFLQIQTPLARAVEEAVLQIQAGVGGSQAGEISIVDPAPLEGAINTAEDHGTGSRTGRRVARCR